MATEILSLRRNQFSSVESSIAALERRGLQLNTRRCAVTEAADMVLPNVAAHAADALTDPSMIRKALRLFRFWRKRRRSKAGELHQRRLFVA